jgi:hypothetical protein
VIGSGLISNFGPPSVPFVDPLDPLDPVDNSMKDWFGQESSILRSKTLIVLNTSVEGRTERTLQKKSVLFGAKATICDIWSHSTFQQFSTERIGVGV